MDWDQLRACGEKDRRSSWSQLGSGSAPRLRREVRVEDRAYGVEYGISSAPAERRETEQRKGDEARDQLRACGEKCASLWRHSRLGGSAPRLRREASEQAERAECDWDQLRACGEKYWVPECHDPRDGISSAPAERSAHRFGGILAYGDQLRACGEKCPWARYLSAPPGSAPRLRREGQDDRRQRRKRRDQLRACGEKWKRRLGHACVAGISSAPAERSAQRIEHDVGGGISSAPAERSHKLERSGCDPGISSAPAERRE